MKVVILAGGFGTRLIEETKLIPKPMIQIGNMPILWHIMKIYSSFGFNDFIICLGYKGHIIREFFINSLRFSSDVEVDLKNSKIKFINNNNENWNVKLIDTGLNSNTGGRLKKIKKFIEDDENFLFTYGDGLIDLNINKLIKFHYKHKRIATVTAVRPIKRFGVIDLKNSTVKNFNEKPIDEGGWINGGFFVLSSKVFDYIKNQKTVFEKDVLPKFAKNSELQAFKHNGFWHPLDTLKDKMHLENLWNYKKPPWKIW